jgi:PAS domain S-box-containing protein
MDLLTSILGRNGFLPHGYCISWTPDLLWPMVASDVLIAASYFSIPLAIVTFMQRRPDVHLAGVAWLFSAFIFACGVTHVMDVWTVWQPDYRLQTATKVVTAGLSFATAVALWPLIPKALKIPTVTHLQSVIASLETEVHKRRTAEEHLADTQQTLAVTLASIGAGFIATDREGRVTRMNAVAERITGWREPEATGESLWDVFAREDRPLFAPGMTPVEVMIRDAVTVDVPHHVTAISRDGRHTALELRAAVTYLEDGSVRGLVLVLRDLTPELRAEADASRLAALVESSSDAIIGKTLEGRITSWNRGAEDMFGWTAEEAIGQPVQMLIPPGRQHEEMRILSELASGRRVPPFDTVRRTKDGRQLDVSLAISPVRNADGRIVGAAKILRDVTSQRRAEIAQRDSEARLRLVLEAASMGDWDLDLATGTVRRSLLHERCYGYDSLQPEWGFATFLRHVHPDDRAEVTRTFRSAVEGQHDYVCQYRVVWPDGSVHWLAARAKVRHEGGRATRMLGVVAEVTQQRLAEEARLKAERLEAENRQIIEANRLKSQFLANMSHELRTPLNAIIGFADLLEGGAVPVDSDKHRQFLGHIGTSGRHLLQLINDVLDLSKVESGKFEFVPEPVHLPALVQEVRDILDPSLQRKQLDFTVELDPEVHELVLDPARLRQVLYNYVSNAIKFTPARGRVTVRARPEGAEHVRIEVEDTGIGIAEDNLARLFVEFQQLDAGLDKSHQGTGLGLALTRRLVQAQGGSVGVYSQPGIGSVFHLVLRRTPAPAQRLLVVEDDEQRRARLVQGLNAAGFAVDAAATAGEARARAVTTPYDGIALELMLPDQAGLAWLADIRNRSPSQTSPVVGMSMRADGGSATFRIADVLTKPIRGAEVAAAIARLDVADAQRAKVLVIDDEQPALDLMRATLAKLGVASVCRRDARQALQELDLHRPTAIILDLMMPGFDGFAALDALGRMPAWRDTPVFVWTSMILSDAEYALLARSAQAIVGKGGGVVEGVLDSLRRWRPAPVRERSSP